VRHNHAKRLELPRRVVSLVTLVLQIAALVKQMM